MRTCFLSIDIEKKEENDSFEGVEQLDNMLDVFKKHKANATLFVTGEVLERYSGLVKKWAKDYEIGCHNYKHIDLDKINLIKREKQIKDFTKLYKNILNKAPKGFRGPGNIIDNEQFPILEAFGFLYDSTVSPRHPWRLHRYRGYKGRAPIFPYYPSKDNYRKKGPSTGLGVKILEIPASPGFMNVPLVGTWVRKLGLDFFKKLFWFKKPKFINFNMHSWDGVKFFGKSSKNSGERYLRQLDEMLGFLKKIGYEFKSGEEIYEKFQKNR